MHYAGGLYLVDKFDEFAIPTSASQLCELSEIIRSMFSFKVINQHCSIFLLIIKYFLNLFFIIKYIVLYNETRQQDIIINKVFVIFNTCMLYKKLCVIF